MGGCNGAGGDRTWLLKAVKDNISIAGFGSFSVWLFVGIAKCFTF